MVIDGGPSPSPTPSASPSSSASASASPSPTASMSTTQATVNSWDSSFYHVQNSGCGHFAVAYNGSTVFVPSKGAIVAGSNVTIIGTGKCSLNNIVATQIGLTGASPTPSPSPSFGPLQVDNTNLTFADTTTTMFINVSEQGYSGVFGQDSLSGTCLGIVMVSPGSGTGPGPFQFAITGQSAGSCNLIISDNHGGSVTVVSRLPWQAPRPRRALHNRELLSARHVSSA